MVRRGFSDAYGSWNMYCTERPDPVEVLLAHRAHVGAVDHDRAARDRVDARRCRADSVDLPQPLSPTSPRVSPGVQVRLTESTA